MKLAWASIFENKNLDKLKMFCWRKNNESYSYYQHKFQEDNKINQNKYFYYINFLL